jgi:hypothetical protein
MDAIPPSVTISGGPGPETNATSITFDLTVDDPAATITCSLDGADAVPCGPAFTVESLSQGGHSLLALATDGSGNVGEDRQGWIVDDTAPVVAIASGPEGTTGAADATFVFSSDDAGAATTCSLDGLPVDPCGSPASYPGLAEGSHLFEVTATDPAGNASSVERSWTVDPAAPAVVLSGGPPAYSPSADATFQISAGDGVDLACAVDGSESAPCSTSVLLTSLADGAHDLDVTGTDGAGNTASAAWIWSVDTTSPALDIQSPPPDPSATGDATVAFGADEPVAAFDCSIDGGPAAACSSPVTIPGLADGTHTFVVTGADAAGNQAEAETSWTVQMPPSVDLSMAVAVTKWPARTDEITSYSVTVTNDGSDVASGVVVAATLTSNERWISSAMDGAACVATSCTLPSLAPGSSARALFTMLPTEPVTNSDVFTVSADQPDPTPADDGVTLVLPIIPGPGSASVVIADSGLPSASANVALGGGVLWTVDPLDVASHEVVDASGLGLFDSGLLQPGGTLWVRMFAAGTYRARDPITATTEPVRVGMTAQGLGAGAFRITWASQPAPAGFAYDVQVRTPGSTVWTKLRNATQAPSMTYVTGGAGSYAFRARLRTTSGLYSGWSIPTTIKA